MSTIGSKLVGCLILAGALGSTAIAQAQEVPARGEGAGRYQQVSDFDGPYAAMPPDDYPPEAREALPPRYDDVPDMIPSRVVYDILRENGYLPLGIPRPRGEVYTMAVISPRGDDGRLVIDARTGRILRFIPASRSGARVIEERTVVVPRRPRGLAPMSEWGVPPRPPASVPRVASRSAVPVPRATPPRAVVEPRAPIAETPAPAPPQQAVAAQPAPAAIVPVAPKPQVQTQPTQEMPAAQTLE
jgi:hypothetical protein